MIEHNQLVERLMELETKIAQMGARLEQSEQERPGVKKSLNYRKTLRKQKPSGMNYMMS